MKNEVSNLKLNFPSSMALVQFFMLRELIIEPLSFSIVFFCYVMECGSSLSSPITRT